MGQNDFNALSILREVPFALVDIYANNRMNQAKNLNILYSVSCSTRLFALYLLLWCNQQTKGWKLKQLLVQRDRDYKERNLTKTSTSFCSPKVLPGVMNSRAAWTVAAPKEWKLKILKFVSVFKAVGGTVWTKGTWHYEGQFVQQQVHISRTWAQFEIGFLEGVHPHNNISKIGPTVWFSEVDSWAQFAQFAHRLTGLVSLRRFVSALLFIMENHLIEITASHHIHYLHS